MLIAPNGANAGPNSAQLQSGTERDGQWRADITIPPGYPNGAWSLQGQAIDGVYHTSDRVSLGTFQVTGSGTVDTQTPIIQTDEVSITPSAVTVGEKVTVEFTATDDIGTQYMTVWLIAPNGANTGPNTAHLKSGTEKEGRWSADIAIPPGYPNGAWSLQGQAIDGVYHTSDRVSLGTFQVTGSGTVDTQTPIIQTDEVSITPSAVTVGEKVTVEFTATDDIGTQYMTVWLIAPNGANTGPNTAHLKSGTEKEGRWSADIAIPPGYPNGAWSLQGQAIDGVYHTSARVSLGTFQVN